MATRRALTEIPAEPRESFGKKVRALRRRGLVPARISQRNEADIFIQMDERLFQTAYRQAGATGVLSIALGSQVLPAMVQRIERHPIRPEILHVDLQRVDLLEPVTAEVAVALVGESPAERSRVGIILRQTETLLIRGLPQELPRVLEADLATLLEVGDRILAKDLALPPGVELLADPELLLASVARPAAEEVPEAVEAEAPATAAEERREETERGTPS